jgi:hypothetical protein
VSKTYQMLWDCGYCGTKGLLGLDHKHCPECGAAQDATRRYFPPEDQKVAVEDHVFTGKDRVCGACQTPNAAKAHFCGGCGAPLDDAREVQTRSDQVAAEGGTFESDSAKKAREEREAARTPAPPPAPPPPRSLLPRLLMAGAAMALVGFIALCGVFFLWKKDADLVSTGHAWERTIAVEEKQAVTESAWKDEVPAGADIQRCAEEKRGSKQVADGEECSTRRKDNGDGTFSESQECKTKYRSEPTHDQRCTYKVQKWVVTRTEKASGGSLKDKPHWPSVKLGRTGECMGCQREGKRAETYTLLFQDSAKKKLSCAVPAEKWQKVAVGSKWTGQVGVLSGDLDCGALKPR